MGGVDKHDKLRSTFALGKHHKFKKYYVKLMLLLVDIALTNSWIYYKMVNPDSTNGSESRADFFLTLAKEMVRTDVDWVSKYKVNQSPEKQDGTDDDEELSSEDGYSHDSLFLPQRQRQLNYTTEGVDVVLRAVMTDQCNPCSFDRLPIVINKRSHACQICNYELRKPKWKGVVMCTNHGVRLCTAIIPSRQKSMPKLYKLDGTLVTDFSWTCDMDALCWSKFHDFYFPRGLFTGKQINLNEKTIKFAGIVYSSELYQQKYKALGIAVQPTSVRKKMMEKIDYNVHVGKE
jgi:hypothetical protein